MRVGTWRRPLIVERRGGTYFVYRSPDEYPLRVYSEDPYQRGNYLLSNLSCSIRRGWDYMCGVCAWLKGERL